MTIYLFIDLPFNEIGCYPASLRDVEGVGGEAGASLKGPPHFLFLLLATLSLDLAPQNTSKEI